MFTLLIFVLVFLIRNCSTQVPSCSGAYDDTQSGTYSERELLQCLFANYSSNARPVDNPSKSVEVNLTFHVVALVQVYDKENAVLLESYITQSWRDHRLAWDPKKYGGVKRVFVPFWQIWEPELTLFDNREHTGTIVEGKKILLKYTGELEWTPQIRISSYCYMAHEKFPFDEQYCSFYFQNEMYDTSLVYLNVLELEEFGKLKEQRCYSLHTEWDIKECSVRTGTYTWGDINSTYLVLEILMDRQYSYHYYLIVLPSVLIVLFIISMFWVSHDSHQRFVLAGGLLFVILLINYVLQQFLPPGIADIPVVVSYLLYAMILLMIVVIISLITLSLHNKDPNLQPVPELMKKIFFNDIIGKATCVTIFSYISMSNPSFENKAWNEPVQRGGDSFSSPGAGSGEHQGRANPFGPNTEKLLEDIRRHLNALASPRHKSATQNEWKQLAIVIDRLSFYLFFVLNIVISSALYAH